MNKLPSRRKTLLINREFQMRFLGYVLLIGLATIGVFYSAKIVFFIGVKSHMQSLGIPENHVMYEFLAKQSRVMDFIFLAAAVVEGILLTLSGLLISHRIAGPIYRMTQDLLKMSDGAQSRKIQFRKGDYFPELAEAFNKQLETSAEKKSA